MNITKIDNGFNINNTNYLFQELETETGLVAYDVLSESQVLIGTNEGFIFLDLSCTIENVLYTEMTPFIEVLYSWLNKSPQSWVAYPYSPHDIILNLED